MQKTKYEEIIYKLGKIEEHLKTLNGSVIKLKKQQMQDDITKAKIQGGWKVLVVLGGIAFAIGQLLYKIYGK